MDDKFLYQNRPPVRSGFSENLYARLSDTTSQSKTPTKRAVVLRFVLASLIVFVLMLTFSESVRADVWNWIRHIAGFEVQEVDNLHDIPGYGEGNSFAPNHPSIIYALKFLPFEFALPAYTPDGYVLIDQLTYDDRSVFLSWVNQDKEEIFIMVSKPSPEIGPNIVVGSNGAEEIEINGQPAMLVRGSYDENDKWDPNFKRLSIYLSKDGLSYLISNEPHSPITTGMEKFEKELIRMASSIPDLKKYDNGVYTYTPQPVEAILQNPPFSFNMPGYIPDGYSPHEGVVAYSKSWVSLNWEDKNSQNINLMVQQDWRITIPAGAESADEKRIGGRSTLIILGGYNENGKWDATRKNVQLYWREGGLIYNLSSDMVSQEELIKMAESIE